MELIFIGAIIAGLVSAWPKSGGTTEARAEDTAHQSDGLDPDLAAYYSSDEYHARLEDARAAAADQLVRAGHDPGPVFGRYTSGDYRDYRREE